MKDSSFRVSFEGDAFNDGEIAVSDLAPALLALGDLLQKANRALNGDRADAKLKVRATNVGSFEAVLSLDISTLGAVKDLLDAIADNPERVVAADQLLELILKGGGILSGATVGLIAAVKWLRGRKPDEVRKVHDGTTQITVNQTTIFVDSRTVKLLEDAPTRNALEDFGNRALSISGLEAVRLTESDKSTELRIEPNDRSSLQAPKPLDSPVASEESERETFLKIVTSHFRDGYKWRFSDGGDKPFTADVEDVPFLKRVSDGTLSLSASDTLRCRIRERQLLAGGGLTKEVKVLEVLEHIPGPRQIPLI